MEKQQILDHIRRIEAEEQQEQEQLLQTPTTALVPFAQETAPPIVESTIIIQEPPLADEEEPITDIPIPHRWRGSFLLLVTFVLILLTSVGAYFLLPILTPSATVIIVPMQKRLSTTATIHIAAQQKQLVANQIPGRLLQSFTLSQSQTVKTTGIGHQAATEASGSITLYNGLLSQQIVFSGTVLTGRDGIQVITDQTAIIPAANPPYEGQATISTHAIVPGNRGNIAAYDITTAFSASILAKNVQPFSGGLDARTYPMVSQSDIDSAVSHLKPTLSQSIQGAFSTQLSPGEALTTPTCVLKTVTDHGVGEEASQVQVSLSETCQAAAYQQADLQQLVTHLVNQEARERYGSGYRLAGNVTVSLANTTITTSNQQIVTVSVNAASQWVYQLGTAERQQIRNQIAGKSKQQALHILSRMDGIRGVTLNLVGGYNDLLPQDTGRIQVVVIYRFV